MDAITIEPLGSHDSGPCECCGNLSRTVWGAASRGRRTIAVYYVHWTLKRPDHGANVDLIVGKWGEGSSAIDRQAIALQFHVTDGVPQLMVIDADPRPRSSYRRITYRLTGRALATPLTK